MSADYSAQEPLAIWNATAGVWETGENLICGHSELFSETWPTSGMTRAGRAFALPTPAPPTDGSACSSLPTPRATDGDKGGPNQVNGRGVRDSLPGVVPLLATPTVSDANGPGRRNATSGRQPDAVFNTGTTLQDVAYMGLLGTPTAHPDNIRSPEQIRTGLTPSEVIAAGGDFGPYTQAIRRWEPVIGRPAPSPTTPGKNDRPRLNPIFVEWMMGLPEGWVTDTGIPRNAQLKALGNGIVPQQMALALRLLMDMP